MNFRKRKVFYPVLILASLIVFFAIITIDKHINTPKNQVKVDTVYVVDTVILMEEEFTEEELVNALISMNVKHPAIVVAQARLETGNYTSKVFQNNNNLFGMKYAPRRVNTQQGKQYGHAQYATWQDSVRDYAIWQSTFLRKLRTERDYLDYLDRNYAECGDYSSKLSPIIAQVKATYGL